MTFSTSPARYLFLGLAALVLVQSARAASDPRKIHCARPCTLVLKAAIGTIDVKFHTVSGTLKTLYQEGDKFELEAGKDYVLFFNESNREGKFSFDLEFIPAGGDSAWSCRVKTISTEPFISVEPKGWSGAPSKVAINTDPTKPFITIDGVS
jgi:hypothetical protein